MTDKIGPWEVDTIQCCDAFALLRGLPSNSIHCMVTSPPYFGQRDYGIDGQIGRENTVQDYVAALVRVFQEARRVLRSDGTLWLNLGDAYSNAGKWGGSKGYNSKQATNTGSIRRTSKNAKDIGAKPKDLLMIPARVAIALQDDGWFLRSDIVWEKPDCMPESVQDRPTKSHEYVYLLSKSERYFYDNEAIRVPVAESTVPRMLRGVSDNHKNIHGAPGQTPHSMNKPRPNANKHDAVGKRTYTGFNERWDNRETELKTRNKRTVWTIPTADFPGAHFAVMPEALVEPCILAGCPANGIVLDMFMGSGTVARVARKLNRRYIGSEINPEYVALARETLRLPYEQHYTVVNNDVTDLPLFAYADKESR